MSIVLDDGVDVCISSGLAGGLKDEHGRGDILVARAVRNHGNHCVKSNARLLQLAVDAGAKPVDLFVSAEAVVATARRKYQLGVAADAVEMESFAVLSAAAARGVQALAVRAIADPVSADLPYDFNQVINKEGQVSLRRVISLVVRSPQRLPALVRFVRESSHAAARLARFLDGYVESLSSQAKRFEELQPAAAG
jgi:nucleoside phosphorylase